jgi:hypothetical protein
MRDYLIYMMHAVILQVNDLLQVIIVMGDGKEGFWGRKEGII